VVEMYFPSELLGLPWAVEFPAEPTVVDNRNLMSDVT
jgi:hypothetical protein